MEYINKDKKKIYYDVINEESSKGVIVFLNGVMASTSSWINQCEMFKKQGYKLILHDFIGQLKSDKFEGIYSFEKHAIDLHDLLCFLKVNASHLIGTSYGGEVALKYAMLYPNKTKSISIVDSVSELDNHLISCVEDWIELAETYNGEFFFNGMTPTIYGDTYIKNNKDLLIKRSKVMNNVPRDYFDGQIGLYKTFINDVFMTNDLYKIKCPSLIICGEEDTLKPVKFSQILNDKIENSILKTIPDCGHVTIFEKPDELNNELLKFITNYN